MMANLLSVLNVAAAMAAAVTVVIFVEGSATKTVKNSNINVNININNPHLRSPLVTSMNDPFSWTLHNINNEREDDILLSSPPLSSSSPKISVLNDKHRRSIQRNNNLQKRKLRHQLQQQQHQQQQEYMRHPDDAAAANRDRTLQDTTTSPSTITDAATDASTSSPSDQCVDAPFLWLIRKTNNDTTTTTSTENGRVEGLGVGTLHLPRQFVVTDNEWQSLVAAAQDGCTVWAEYDLNDPTQLADLQQCDLPIVVPMFVSNIPDANLRTEMERLVLDITTEYTLFPNQVADAILTQNTMDTIYLLIAYWNSNDTIFRDNYFETTFSGNTNLNFLDTQLLDLGFETNGLETTEETCQYLESLSSTSPSRNDFINNWDTIYADKAWMRLNDTIDDIVDAYQCGQIEPFNEYWTSAAINGTWDVDPEPTINATLDVRNIKMVDRMVTAMEESPHVPLFAVGIAHWYIRNNSLANLLEERGYTLERVDGPYDPALFPDPVCSGTGSNGGDGDDSSSSTSPSTEEPTTVMNDGMMETNAPTTNLADNDAKTTMAPTGTSSSNTVDASSPPSSSSNHYHHHNAYCLHSIPFVMFCTSLMYLITLSFTNP